MPRPRSSTSNLVRLLNQSSGPVYALNDKRQVVFCNESCAQWLKLESDEIIGTVLNYHSQTTDDPKQELLSGLCPPPGLLDGTNDQAIVVAKYPDAIWSRRKATFMPLNEDKETIGILVYVDSEDLPSGTTTLDATKQESQQLHDLIIQHRREFSRNFPMDALGGKSDAIKRVRQKISLALQQPANVVITGPAGVGKDTVARTIHYNHTPRFSGALTPVACDIVTDEMLKTIVSDFIAECSRADSFDSATLLLLNVDKLAATESRLLLNLLNEAPQSVLTISTSAVELDSLVETANFPETLASRLSTLSIHIPPLAARPEDIPILAQLILESANVDSKVQVSGFSSAAMDLLIDHPWHENLSELNDVVSSSIKQCTGHEVAVGDLPESIQLVRDADRHQRVQIETPQLDQTLQDVEYQLLAETLIETDGNKAEAARRLGISRARLIRRWQALQNSNNNNGQSR